MLIMIFFVLICSGFYCFTEEAYANRMESVNIKRGTQVTASCSKEPLRRSINGPLSGSFGSGKWYVIESTPTHVLVQGSDPEIRTEQLNTSLMVFRGWLPQHCFTSQLHVVDIRQASSLEAITSKPAIIIHLSPHMPTSIDLFKQAGEFIHTYPNIELVFYIDKELTKTDLKIISQIQDAPTLWYFNGYNYEAKTLISFRDNQGKIRPYQGEATRLLDVTILKQFWELSAPTTSISMDSHYAAAGPRGAVSSEGLDHRQANLEELKKVWGVVPSAKKIKCK